MKKNNIIFSMQIEKLGNNLKIEKQQGGMPIYNITINHVCEYVVYENLFRLGMNIIF